MINKDEFPELIYLLEAYYFQEWEGIYGPAWNDPIRHVIDSESGDCIHSIKQDIERFLSRHFSEDDMRAFADSLFIGAMEEDFRDFLVAVRDMLDAALERSFYRG